MNPDTPEPTFEESIKQVIQTLPPVIREYITQGKYTPVAINLTRKYGLRIDQSGVLEREIMLLLMGVDDPSEFAQALAEEAKINQETINNIAKDINDQIFVPLREEEEAKGINAPQHAKLAATYTPPQRPLAPHVAPLPPKTAMPQSSRPAATRTLGEVVRSMLPAPHPLDARLLLEDHEESHIELDSSQKTVGSITKTSGLPAMTAAPRAVPLSPAVPAVRAIPSVPTNLPGAMPPYIVPPMQAQQPINPRPISAPAAPMPPKPLPPVIPISAVKSYSTDPYREPIDEPPVG